MTLWISVVVAGIATYLIRFSFIAMFGKVEVPPLLERALRYVAPAVLAAIALPGLIVRDGGVDVTNPYVPAAIVGGLAAYFTKSIGAAIVVGLPALWLFTWMVG